MLLIIKVINNIIDFKLFTIAFIVCLLVCGLMCENGGTLNAEDCICRCVSGYDGPDCSNDINECTVNRCQHEGTCNDLINSYACNCALGYTGRNCETNIDDCVPNPCRNRGTCTDGINSYTCNCLPRYTGKNCEYINITR